jgi:hypothetical protein
MEIVGEVLCLKIEGSLKDWLKYLLQGLDLIEAREREREFELKKLWFKVFSSQ